VNGIATYPQHLRSESPGDNSPLPGQTAPSASRGTFYERINLLTIKLLPSRKSASRSIRWFASGQVIDHQSAARDIAAVVDRLQGRSRVVRGLTLTTDQGTQADLGSTGLHRAVKRAGLIPLN